MADTIAADPAFRQALIISAVSILARGTTALEPSVLDRGCKHIALIACRIADEVMAIESAKAPTFNADGTIPAVRGAHPPMHPGELIWKDLMPAKRWTVEQFADEIDITTLRAYEILRCEVSLTDLECASLGMIFGNGQMFWQHLQQTFNVLSGKSP